LAFASARSAIVYDARAKAFVHAWKEHGVRRLAAIAAELVLECVEPPRVDALLALPADHDRSLRRGTHPAEQLAALLGAAWGLPSCRSLARAAGAGRQRGRSLEERRANVRGAFVASGIPPASVALVDDVLTTGATVDAAARALRRAGTRRVEVVTLARVERLR
jgi:predicted amidophosphoribosyltransferase